jgi:hypothetical protein
MEKVAAANPEMAEQDHRSASAGAGGEGGGIRGLWFSEHPGPEQGRCMGREAPVRRGGSLSPIGFNELSEALTWT